MSFLKINTSKLNSRYGRGGPAQKSMRVSEFNTLDKNRAPEIPKTEAKEGDNLSYFDEDKGKVLTYFDGGYQSSNTFKVSDKARYDIGQYVSNIRGDFNSIVDFQGVVKAGLIRTSLVQVTDDTEHKYLRRFTDNTCDTSSGSTLVTCEEEVYHKLWDALKMGDDGEGRDIIEVSGTGIPSGCLVSGIGNYNGGDGSSSNSGKNFTLSSNATASNTNVTLTFKGQALHLDGSLGGDVGSVAWITLSNDPVVSIIRTDKRENDNPEPTEGVTVASAEVTIVTKNGGFYIGTDAGSNGIRGQDFNDTHFILTSTYATGYSASNYARVGGENMVKFTKGVDGWYLTSMRDYRLEDSNGLKIDMPVRMGSIFPMGVEDGVTSTLGTSAFPWQSVTSNNVVIGSKSGTSATNPCGKHIMSEEVTVLPAHSGDNTVSKQASSLKIPAYAIITRVVAVVKTASNLSTHNVNIQLSATSGTSADASISSGTEILGAGVANTDSSDSTSTSDIDLKNDAKKVWICNDQVINGASDQYVYVCNAGTGNGTTNSNASALTVIIEYYGID